MFQFVKARFEGARTLRYLLEAAGRHALADQQRGPGAEHLLLAALDMPDGTAQKIFADFGTDGSRFREAVASQQKDALFAAGWTGPEVAPEPLPPRGGLYRAGASAIEVMKTLSAGRERHRPLTGAHVVAAVASLDHGVAARALRSMSIDLVALRQAASRCAAAK